MPKETDSTTKFKADISQLKAAMQEASRSVRLASSEFKAATAGMDDWSKTADGLSAKTKQLNSTLEAQKKQLRSLEEQYRLTVQEQVENSKGAEELAIKINHQKAAIQTTEKSLDGYEKALDDIQNANEEAGESAQKASDGFTVMKGALASLVADGIRAAISGLKDLAKEAYQAGATFESSMSQVAAVSGANAEQLDQLTKKAQEMGAKTKFSASESAEAFNYMAMAGWKTDEMLNGIEGIMNLAAASGSDLATTSDIVTDALTAMGYSAGDAGKLADVMAAASSNANTNVEMMGKTFQYAAPIVGALGMNMEDTAVAIGMMANAGIKADKAGTALRSILTRLSAPPKECATEMDKLGLSLTDSSGKMKSLDTVMRDLRKAFSNLSETEQTAAAKHLAGAEAMSGLLAIVNGSETDFLKLTDAIDKSSGSAQKMADTMNDNVNGQLTLLKSQIEGIMIKLFDKASDSMRKGINSVSEALDDVNWDKVGEAVGVFAEKAANLFSYILTNGSSIISILTTIASVAGTLFAINKIGAFIGWLNSLMRTYTSLNAVLTTVKGTQLALNAAQLASPIGLAVAAIGTLTAAYIINTQKRKENAQAAYGLSNAEKELIKETKNAYDAQKQLVEARNESIEATTGEFEYIKRLKDEYNGLVDSNGKVKKGYEDRANFIQFQLAKSLGIELEEVQKLIDKNGELGKSIDELIIKKQAEATRAAYEDSYAQAKSQEYELLQKVIDNQNNYTKAKENYYKLQEQYKQVEKEMHEDMLNGGNAVYQYQNKLITLEDELNAAKESFNKNKEAVEQSTKAYQDGQQTIKSYEGLGAAIVSEDVTAINRELNKLTTGFKDASSATEKELQEQVKDYEKYYNDIVAAQKAGNPVITKEMVNGAKEAWESAKKEYEKATPQLEKTAKNSKNTYIKGLNDNNSGVEKAAKNTVKKGVDAATKESKNFDKSGKDGGTTYGKGIEGTKDKVEKSAKKLTTSANKTLSSNEAKKSAETSGKNFGLGFGNGITAKDVLTKVGNAAKKLVDWALSKLKKEQKEGSPSKVTAQSGKFFGLGYEKGINATQNIVGKAAANIASVALRSLSDTQQEGALSKLTYKSGQNFTQGYIKGIVSLQGSLVKTSQNMVKTVMKELLNLQNFNFSEIQQKASDAFSKALSDKLSYMINKINYTTNEKLKDYENTINSLEEKQQQALESTSKRLADEHDKTLTQITKSSEDYQQKLADEEAAQLQGVSDASKRKQEKLTEEHDKSLSELSDNSTNRLAELAKNRDKQLQDITNESTATLQRLADEEAAQLKEITDNSSAEQERLNDKINELEGKKQTKKRKKQVEARKEELEEEKEDLQKRTDEIIAAYEKSVNAEQKALEKRTAEINKAYEEAVEKENKALSDKQKEIDKTYESAIQKEKQILEDGTKQITETYEKRIKEEKEGLESRKKALEASYKSSTESEKKAINDKYNKLIEAEETAKEAYQQASQKMIQELQNAMNAYQQAAQKLIDDTMSGITSKYQKQYDALINKQDTLINKLKNAGDLFNISGANVMTVNDIRAQTEQITQYAAKLKKIKEKVSSELFDQIASYDMKEGSAFIDRLLAMSTADLNAYNKAYTEKMEAAQSLSENIYKDDFEKVKKDYKNEVKKAFSGIEKELQKLGEQSMKGFIEGLTADTDYMKGEVKKYIDEMIAAFRNELGIHSPSKVTMQLGRYTGEGFADGLKDMIKTVKKAAEQITDSVTDTLDFGDIGSFKSVANNYRGNSSNGVYGADNAVRTQVINFNQTNNSPKALDRLTIYRQTNNMLFGAKVRLNNV